MPGTNICWASLKWGAVFQYWKMFTSTCLTNLIIAEGLITFKTDQGEPVDVVYLDFSKALDSVRHRLLI